MMEIVVDFDGTCVTHEYPLVGSDIGAVPVLKLLVENGHKLILSTMRSNKPFIKQNGEIDNSGLDDAVKWFKDNGIRLYGVQTNPTQKHWTDSPKAYGQLHIDDAALGCPLIYPTIGRPYVDWKRVESMLWEMGLFKFEPKVTPEEAIENYIADGRFPLKVFPKEYYLFLDDERNPVDVYNFMKNDGDYRCKYYEPNDSSGKTSWTVVRSYDEFVNHIKQNGVPKMISFDHDLADFSGPDGDERTGFDCAKFIAKVYMDNLNSDLEMFEWEVHSKNSVGVENINGYLYNLKDYLESR